MFSALPTVEHEQVLRSFVREETILRYLKDQASSSSSSCSNGYRLGVRYADFYFVPSPNSNSSTTSEEGENTTRSLRRFRLGNGFLSAYCDDDCLPRVDARLLAALGVSMQGATATTNERPKTEVDAATGVSGGSHLDATTPRVTEADMRELEGPLLQSTVRILTLLDVVRTVLFGKGLLTVSSAGSPLGDPRRGRGDVFGEEEATSAAQQHQHGEIAQTPLSEASTAIRRRIFPGLLPVPVAVKNRPDGDAIDVDDERVVIGDVGVGAMGSSDDGDDARLRSVIAAAYNVAKDEFQCTGGGGIRSSAARSYLVRSVAYMQRIRDKTAQNGGGPTHKQSSRGFLWEVARTCQECVNQLEELDKNFMFSSARDEFYECIGDIGADGVPMTETVLVVCGEEVKASFAFFQDAAHSLYSWAMNCMEMVDAYEQQGLLPAATTVATPLHTSTTTTSLQTKTLTSRGGHEGEEDGTARDDEIPIRDVSSSYLSLEDRAQSMYEYPQSAVTTQSTQFIDIMSATAQALQSLPQLAATCPLTARLNASCAIYVSGQRLLSVPYFSSIRQLILSVERETERVDRLSNNGGNDDVDAQAAAASNGGVIRLSPPASRFQFLLDTLRLYYITSVTADEKKTLEHFGSVTVALLSELAAEKALMEINRGAILTSLQARWEARQLDRKEGGSDGGDEEGEEDYYLPDPLLPLYTKEERDTLTVSFGAFFRTRSAIRGLIGALQKDIMRRNRTHGVVMVTATVPTSSSTRSGLFSASVVPLVVRHYRTQKGKAQPNQTSPGRATSKQQQQRSPMENTSVRTVSAMESDENYFQGAEGSASSLFVSPRHFYESGKSFLVRQGSRLPTLKVPLPTSTLAEWRRLVTEVPVAMRRGIETGCSSSRRHDDGVVQEDRDPRSTMYPVSMVPIGGGLPPTTATRASSAVRLEGVVEEEVEEGPTSVGIDDDVDSWGSSSSPLRILQGMWKTISCSLSPASEEVQGARRFPSGPPPPVGGSAVFKGPPKSVVSPLVYRKEALLIALIDADNESQRMHEALVAEYPTLYAAGSSCASAERMKTASMRFATAFMPPAAAAATERDEERGPVVEGIMGTTDKIIATIQSRTRALLDLAEVRKTQEGRNNVGNTKKRGGESNDTTLLSHVARVAQQYSIVFDPPK